MLADSRNSASHLSIVWCDVGWGVAPAAVFGLLKKSSLGFLRAVVTIGFGPVDDT